MNGLVKDATFDRGLACHAVAGRVDGTAGDHVILAPPYMASAEDIDVIVDLVAAGIDGALSAPMRRTG